MRTDGDSWDIVTSVGLTALGVATFRALETIDPEPMIHDEYATWFVEAAGEPHFMQMLHDPESVGKVRRFGRLMGVRTRFFDEFFAAAWQRGVRQAVILASGLDARAYRLDWPAGMVVFEIDQPRVLEFKDRVLAEHGAVAKADRRVLAVDLREYWPDALTAAGFDPGRPAAWSAEGLLPFLPGPSHDALFERIDALSAPGSSVATDDFGRGVDPHRFADTEERFFGSNPFGNLDVSDLWYDDARAEPGDWLSRHGWSVHRTTPVDLAATYGHPITDVPAELLDLMRQAHYVSAEKRR
ncbi:class I SAM-dependent methyltransferase [Nocardia aurantiaca]|uniref:S-adenosyl-L-methionine-dependent methyltransferase n=1 Tax=Nocardia aurantiaca TaxID=2675850 RepID=A0A6I3KXC8_9NOCA|nr:class I SAM-dependent methyltransferase [Nocardia aurantiaca]MTE15473.1 SAM-dependent methyltransferase [Nocardia aurantiaca]